MGNTAPLDGVTKLRVKDALLGQIETKLSRSRDDETAEHRSAEVDPGSSYTTGDQVFSDQAGEMAGLLEGVDHRQADLAARVQELDFQPTSQVGPGSIVEFDGDRYVIGVAAASFECDGVDYEGISTDAPIYQTIGGLRRGDTFTFAGHEHRIDLVV